MPTSPGGCATCWNPKLRDQGLGKLYEDLEVPLIEVLAELEFNGIRLDVPLLQKPWAGDGPAAGRDRRGDLSRWRAVRSTLPRSKQLRKVLFDELKLPAQRKTGITGEASTDQETLERLAALGPPAAARKSSSTGRSPS